jgi:glycosyltransferase involved in cell wall biosynthesis
MLVRDGESGLCVPCDRPDALVGAAVRLATDAPLRGRLRLAAREAVEVQSWERVIARFERDLEELAGVAHAAAGPAPVPA